MINRDTLTIEYVGVGRRIFAFVLDAFVLLSLSIFFLFIPIAVIGGGPHIGDAMESDFVSIAFLIMFGLVIPWLYNAMLESSVRQGTIGKISLSIYVTDTEGNRLTFWQASRRFFAKVVFGIAFIAAAFDPQKQSLHDKIANTLVLSEYGEPMVGK